MKEMNDPEGEVIGIGPDEFAKGALAIAAGRAINYDGASGPCDFDAYGRAKNRISHWRVSEGQANDVGVYDTDVEIRVLSERDVGADASSPQLPPRYPPEPPRRCRGARPPEHALRGGRSGAPARAEAARPSAHGAPPSSACAESLRARLIPLQCRASEGAQPFPHRSPCSPFPACAVARWRGG